MSEKRWDLIQLSHGGVTHVSRGGVTLCGMSYSSGGVTPWRDMVTCKRCIKIEQGATEPKLTKIQKTVLAQLQAGDELNVRTTVQLYSVGSPRKGWTRLSKRTVEALLEAKLIEEGDTVGYTTRFRLTEAGRTTVK